MPAALRRLVILALVPLTVLLTGLALVGGAGSASAMSRAHRISAEFRIVRHQEGAPYRYGADGPHAFDCSGLVYYSARRAGFHGVPRTSSEQARHMRRIRRGQLRRGDFVFFYHGAARAGSVYHVGVFAGFRHGRRTIIHAPFPGQRVHREAIWTNSWFAGTLR